MTIKNSDDLEAVMTEVRKRVAEALAAFGGMEAWRIANEVDSCLQEAGINDSRAQEQSAVILTSGRALVANLADANIEAAHIATAAERLAQLTQVSGRRQYARSSTFRI